MAGTLAPGTRTGTFGISANAIDALLLNGAKSGANPSARVAGLLPIRLDLPDNGVAYDFAGGGEPGTLSFRYTDWRSAARWRWVWLTLGAAAFLLFAAGWAHPWRRTLWVVLALTFWPLVVAPSALTSATRCSPAGCGRCSAGGFRAACCDGGGSSRWPLLCAAALLLPTVPRRAQRRARPDARAVAGNRHRALRRDETRRRASNPRSITCPTNGFSNSGTPPSATASPPRPNRRPAANATSSAPRATTPGSSATRWKSTPRSISRRSAKAGWTCRSRSTARWLLDGAPASLSGERRPVGRHARRASPRRHPAPARRNAGGGERACPGPSRPRPRRW